MRRGYPMLVAGVVLLVATVLGAETFVVKVRATVMRSFPKFFAPSVVVLKAGDGVVLVEREADWLQVRASGGTVGWIHLSVVEPKRTDILARGERTQSRATANEVALAAKGLSRPPGAAAAGPGGARCSQAIMAGCLHSIQALAEELSSPPSGPPE